MPDTYSLQWGMCLKGIGLTAGKKRGIINDSDFKCASKKMDYHFNFCPLSFFANGNSNYICSGQLLSNNTVLTASSWRQEWGKYRVSVSGFGTVVVWYRTACSQPALLQLSFSESAMTSKVEPGQGGGRGCKFQRMLYSLRGWHANLMLSNHRCSFFLSVLLSMEFHFT